MSLAIPSIWSSHSSTFPLGDPDEWTASHFRVGLVLLILSILQVVHGTLLHMVGKHLPATGVKSILRYLHPVTGIAILAMGFYQPWSGFGQWGKPGMVPKGTIIAWGVLLAFWSILYLAGLGLLPKQWKQDKTDGAGYEKGTTGHDVRESSDRALTRPSEISTA
ncbi:hypothetical protein P7C73_g4860, partial [Tremellales sp. Uapishka_1]